MEGQMSKGLLLTVGMPTYGDFPGVFMSITSITTYHQEVLPYIEIVVVDNGYGDQRVADHSRDTENLINNLQRNNIRARYIRYNQVIGTAAAKQKVVEEAAAPWTLLMDSHVILPAGTLSKVLDFVSNASNNDNNLYHGTLLSETQQPIATHFDDVWRGEMWGIWGLDHQGIYPNGKPFVIFASGLGLALFRTASWPNFHPSFKGFGGEEVYIHMKYRRQGGQVYCIPWLRWIHRFGRTGSSAPPATIIDKVRNYIIGHKDLGLSLDRVYNHFVLGKNEDGSTYKVNTIPESVWNSLVQEEIDYTPTKTMRETTEQNNPQTVSTPEYKQTLPDQTQAQQPQTYSNPPNQAVVQSRGGCGQCGSRTTTTPEPAPYETPTPDEIYQLLQKAWQWVAEKQVQNILLVNLVHPQLLEQLANTIPGRIYIFHHYSGIQPNTPEVAMIEKINTQFPYLEDNNPKIAAHVTFDVIETAHMIPPADVVVIYPNKYDMETVDKYLNAFMNKANKRIVIPGGAKYGYVTPDHKPGLYNAIIKNTRERKQEKWSVVKHIQDGYGLTVISKFPEDKPALPNKLKMAANFIKAVSKHVMDGLAKVPRKLFELRLAQCEICEHRTTDPENGLDRCSVCGCYLAEWPNGNPGKAAWRSEICPIGKWEEVDQSYIEQELSKEQS